MKRALTISILLCSAVLSILPQKRRIDWAALFEGAVVNDTATNDKVRDEITGQILPQLCTEDAPLAAAEVPPIVEQFNRKEDGIRLQASALLGVLAECRPDSAAVLSQALPALMDHTHDPVARIRTNSAHALCSLKPAIPGEEVHFLIPLMDDRDESLAKWAVLGIARMASLRADAADAIERALSQSNSPGRRVVAIHAIAAAHATSPQILSRIGGLLSDKDTGVTHAALETIGQLGNSAIRANLNQLNQLAETSGDSELVNLARQLIERQSSVH